MRFDDEEEEEEWGREAEEEEEDEKVSEIMNSVVRGHDSETRGDGWETRGITPPWRSRLTRDRKSTSLADLR